MTRAWWSVVRYIICATIIVTLGAYGACRLLDLLVTHFGG